MAYPPPLFFFCFFLDKNGKVRHFCSGWEVTFPSSFLPARTHSRVCKGSPFAMDLWGPSSSLWYHKTGSQKPQHTPPACHRLLPSTAQTKAHTSLTKGVSTPRYTLFMLVIPRWCVCRSEDPPFASLFPASAWHAGPLLCLTQPAGEVAQGLLTWAISGWDGVLSPRKVCALSALGYSAFFSERIL